MLLKSAVTGEEIPEDIDYEPLFDSIIKLAKAHEVFGIAAFAMLSGGLNDPENRRLAKKNVYEASFIDTKNNYTYKLASEALNDAGIQFVPLKGTLIRKLYPESWMRTSCDTDILVREKDFERAVALLKQAGFTQNGNLNYHDMSLIYDNTNLELHFSICEDMKCIDLLLKKVWDYVAHKENCMYLQTPDYFAFHHIAHMAHHFICGGCGIRPFLDLWMLKRNNAYNPDAVRKMCESSKIDVFYDAAMQTIDVWFENAGHTELTRRIEKYIITGGAYGYYPNGAAASTARSGGKVRYLLALAFPSYSSMRVLYPVLNTAPVLLPFCYLVRLFQKTFGKKNSVSKQKYKVIKGQNADLIKEVGALIKDLELDK